MTMLVLSPSVEAMKASASSIPAATRASVSRPAPTVNWPPRSSQPLSSPTSSRACDSGSSSRQETSCPSLSIERATEEPTRPQPTIRMNTAVSLDQRLLLNRPASALATRRVPNRKDIFDFKRYSWITYGGFGEQEATGGDRLRDPLRP